MPLMIVPYTLGTQLPAAPAAPTGGVAYYGRRKRFIAYILTMLLLAVVLQ